MERAIDTPGLTPSEKLLLVVLASYDGPGGCWPAIDRLVDKTGLTRRHVRRLLRQLEERDLLLVKPNAGGAEHTPADRRPNRYVLRLEAPDPAQGQLPGTADDGGTPTSPRGGTPTRATGGHPRAPRGDTHVPRTVSEPSMNPAPPDSGRATGSDQTVGGEALEEIFEHAARRVTALREQRGAGSAGHGAIVKARQLAAEHECDARHWLDQGASPSSVIDSIVKRLDGHTSAAPMGVTSIVRERIA